MSNISLPLWYPTSWCSHTPGGEDFAWVPYCFLTLLENLQESKSVLVVADMKRALNHDTDAALVASDARVRRAAMETLGNLDKAALALHAGGTTVGVLVDADADVRLDAVFTLGKLNANAEALIVRMLDTDALDKVLEHIDDGAYLAVWLTCNAFNARRPASTFTTSVRAMCATQSTLDWAIGIGLQPPMVLKALREFGTAKLALSSVTIPCMFKHRDEDVRVDAMKTAHGLLLKLANLDPAELLNQHALATYIGFITEMLLHGRRQFSNNWVFNAAEWALETIVCKLGKLDAHATLTSILDDMIGHSQQAVRIGAFNALNALDPKSIACHADGIARFALNAAAPGGESWDCERALDALYKLDAGTLSAKLDAGTLSAFVCMVVELMWHDTDIHVHYSALRAFGKIDKTAISSHAVTIARKLNDPDEIVVQTSLHALGMLNQADLVQHADAIVDKLKDANAYTCWTCAAFSALRNMAESDLANRAADIAEMLDNVLLRDLAEETLDLLKPVALVYHNPHAVSRMLSGTNCVRERTLRTLMRMDVAELLTHKSVLEYAIRVRHGLCTATEEALLKRIQIESSVQLV